MLVIAFLNEPELFCMTNTTLWAKISILYISFVFYEILTYDLFSQDSHSNKLLLV